MKTDRLDEILIRKGLVTEDQIRQALMRQRSRGGKLGSHLLYFKFLSEEQLIRALAEQFGVAGVRLASQNISDSVIKRVPADVAEEYVVFPFQFDPETRTLSVAMADPENVMAISAVRRAARVSKVKAHVAPEIILRNLIASHYHGRSGDVSVDQIISLPDLFGEPVATSAKPRPDAPPLRKVLLVTGTVFLKSLLPSIFEREGFELRVVSDPEQAAAALRESPCERILVSEDVEEAFNRMVATGALGSPLPAISVFRTLTSALMDNPAPYSRVFGSLLRSVQLLADHRSSTSSWEPPYALISQDIQEIGRSIGLRALTVDGLRVAAHLLAPSATAAKETPGKAGAAPVAMDVGSFQNFNHSVHLAESMDFPWDIPACLNGFLGLMTGADPLSVRQHEADDMALATQTLALVWYRYHAFQGMQGSPEAALGALKSGLRQQAGRLAPSSVVESYVSILERAFRQDGMGIGKNIFVVGDVRGLASDLVHELKRRGFRTVEIPNLAEAQPLYNRQRPAAVLVNYDNAPDLALKFGRLVTQDSLGTGIALFALTASSEPSLIMNLIEAGFNDVFAPPFRSDMLIARISKTLAVVAQQGEASSRQRGFGATFNELAFLDLIQALAGGGKSVRITLERSSGEKAEIYMRGGRMLHATCGDTSGVEAVYKVITWRDDGSFRIEPTTRFPQESISTPNDYVLLEGCRRLDEAEG